MSDPEYPEPKTEVPSLAPDRLYRRLASGERVSILDLRDRDEYETWHIGGQTVDAVQLPYVRFVQAEITDGVDDLFEDTGLDQPVVAVCARGDASAYVASLLRGAGIEAVNLASGMHGWAGVYVDAELASTGDTTVRQYYRPSSGCLSYLLADGEVAVVVDPLRAFVDRYQADADELGLSIEAVLDTHVHADHVSGLRSLARETEAEQVVPRGAFDRGLAFEAAPIEDGEMVEVGSMAMEAIHAPGHTTEMTAFLVSDVLLAGDSLFLDSVARPDLERGDEGARELAGSLYETLHGPLSALPNDTTLAPGHVGPVATPSESGTFAATLNEVREQLSVLQLDRETFIETVVEDMPPRPANFETIIAINLGTRTTDEEEAFELELGPNNCAVSLPA